MTTQEKLERIQYRTTKYELVATHEDGTRYLAGYTRISKQGIFEMLRKNGQDWADRISQDAMMTFDKKGHACTMGPFRITFSHRTQRDAILEGELPFFTVLPTVAK